MEYQVRYGTCDLPGLMRGLRARGGNKPGNTMFFICSPCPCVTPGDGDPLYPSRALFFLWVLPSRK